MSVPRQIQIVPEDVIPHWQYLAGQIGERRAGSDAEHTAAEYIQKQFRQNGIEARMEAFQCNTLRHAKATLEVFDEGKWTPARCEILVGSPSTKPSDKPREMELVWIEMPEQSPLLKAGSMKGKALALFGPLGTNTDDHRAIVQTGASLIVWIDDRLPFDWAKADGILPVWARRVGALPTIAAPFRDAYMWRTRGVNKIRACVETRHFAATSYNVIADLPGTDPKLGIIAFGCHYDTQCGNVGADDNGSGTVGIIALAKAFAAAAFQKPFARGMRFIAFGTEEQLSVGAAEYSKQHRDEMAASSKRDAKLPGGHALMINLDSTSSALGHTELLVSGSKAFENWAVKKSQSAGVLPRTKRQVTPFADHFPFTMYGVPAVWFGRPNFAGMRWQHHSIHDNLSTVSPQQLCKVLNAVVALAADAGDAKKLPFKSGIDPKEHAEIRRLALELFDIKI